MFTMDQLSKQCRTCLASSNCLEPLDSECEQGCSFKFMLTSFCTLQMDDISVMYDNICKDCSSEILRAYNFKLQCEQNDVILREKAQTLQYDELCKRDVKNLSPTVDVSIVKDEIENNHYYFDENKSNVHVKEEDWMEGDDHRSSEDDDTYNSDAKSNKKKSTSKKKKKPLKKSPKSISKAEASTTESVAKSKCGRKRKSIPQEEAKLIDNSFKSLGYKRVYECPRCGNLCKSFNLVHKHLDKIHDIVLKSVEEFDEMCVQERKARGIQEELKDVKKFDPKNPMYKCIECPHRCKDYEAMKKHIIEQHRETKYIHCCEDLCQYSTHDVRHLMRHIQLMHKTQRRYKCDKCEYQAHSRTVFDLHYTTKHLNIKPFVCQQCDKEFVTNQSLRDHIAIKHEKKVVFTCPTCYKDFYIKRYLRDHMRSHSDDKRHICEHCGCSFSHKSNLEKHVFTMHLSSQEKTLACPECPYKAKNVYNLDNHMRRHRDMPRFYCDYCGRDFVSKQSVKIHIWRHLKWKPYKCSTCSYTCYSTSNLLRHSKKHTGERPYPCKLCDYRSISKQRLESHMESHLNRRRHTCELCPYKANHKYLLKRHLKRHYKGDRNKLSRNYAPQENKTAIDFTQFNINHLIPEDGQPSASVIMDVPHMKVT